MALTSSARWSFSFSRDAILQRLIMINAAKVAVINESMARRYWPKGNALGSAIVVDKIERQIVGVVHDFAYHSPDNTDPNRSSSCLYCRESPDTDTQ